MDAKSINNITLALIVVLLGLIVVGIMGAGDNDENPSYASSPNYGMVPPAPFSLAGGTVRGAAPTQAGNPGQQRRVPNEGIWLNMEIEGLSPGTIRERGLPENQTGVIVDSVPPGSPAEKAGLRNGDIIKAINGQIIVNMADYIKATENQKIKSAIVEVERDGRVLSFVVPPGAEPWRPRPGTGPKVDTSTGASPKIINYNTVPPITFESLMPHAYRGVCIKCHMVVQSMPPRNSMTNSLVGTATQTNSSLPSPSQQRAAHKVLVEGHWLGMELIPITPELERQYNLPIGIKGLLVDEVTLEAAESGLLAGDVLQSVNMMPIKTLEDFMQVTKRIESLPAATLGIVRNKQSKTLTLRSSWSKLGVAQNEAAQPIQPGAISPHKSRGRPCTDCHIIMKNGGQLQTDAGDILPSPPPIARYSKATHSYRGQCNTCHVIL
jgi:membrane-associated protease RseP (regulator of RpoE activity)